ncbi:MAG: WHG domain-containing protein [Acidimicrobiales bacterium]
MFLFPPALGPAATVTGRELAAATQAFELPAAAAAAAVEAGDLRPDLDPFLVALTSWSAVHGVAAVLQLGFDFSPDLEERLVDSVIDAVIRGFQ